VTPPEEIRVHERRVTDARRVGGRIPGDLPRANAPPEVIDIGQDTWYLAVVEQISAARFIALATGIRDAHDPRIHLRSIERPNETFPLPVVGHRHLRRLRKAGEIAEDVLDDEDCVRLINLQMLV
jgi:hypothetical protein